MRYQDQLVKATQKAVDDVCRAALAVPRDHRDVSPGGEARSVLRQMQEIASSAGWFGPIFREGRIPEFGEHARTEAERTRETYGTVEKCVEAARSGMGDLCQLIASFPERDLDNELVMPFGGGVTMTMADILALPQWNMVYHLGQINQIQLLLGDREMH